jgi:DNA-binding NarL/FixJ family response regulator
MCTARSNAVEVLLSFAAGADGFIIKPIPPRELVGAISQVVEGATFLCARTQNLLGCSLKPKCIRTNSQVLTFREEDVMGCLLQHHSNKQIAEQLGMKGGTVHAHLTNLFGKLKAHTRAQACRKYQRGT